MTKNVKEKTTELNAHNEITKYLMGKVHKKANPLNPKGSPFIESPSSDLFNQPLDWKADKYSQKDSTRNRSPITTAKIEKQGKVKTITKQAVQRILEGIKLNNQGSGNIITIQSFKPVKTASAKVATMFPSKKNSTNLVTFADSQKTSRANSRKSTSTKSKGSTPTQSPAQTSHTDWCQGSQPLNIKIENKDFIAKLMNINIIKIKPDLRNNPCFCKGIKNPASEAAPEHRRTPRGQTISVENKKKENLSKSKSPSAKNKSASDRSNDLLSKRRLSKNKKIGLLPTKVALKSPDSQR